MRAFISGSKVLKNYIKDGGLPKAVLSEIDSIMDEGAEIIIGDCDGVDTLVQKYLHDRSYSNVTVYVSDAKYRTRNNIGNWEEKHFGVHKGNGYGMHIEKDLHMAEDADCGLAIWDGESKGTFINMVCLAAQEKMCSVYLLNEQKWMEIRSLGELKVFLEPRDGWNDEDIEKVLAKCGFSEEMRNHLVTEHLISGRDLIDIVCQAPISLEEKYQTLEYLGRDKNILKNEVMESANQKRDYGETWKWFKNMIRAIVTDENELSVWSNLGMAWRDIYDAGLFTGGQYDYGYMDKVLYLFEEWYDTDSFIEKSSGAGMFRSMSNVLQYIAREEVENDTGEGWYRVEAWEPLDEDWKEIRYDYYLFDNKICWFEKRYPEKEAHGNIYYMPESLRFSSGGLDLDLPTPYKTGNIVLIDCRPFGPPFHAMILESRDQWDCCFPNIVFQVPYTDKWRMAPLKHKRFFKHAEPSSYVPMLSPLYRIRKVRREEMTEEDDRLLKLSDFLSGKESRAAAVWEAWEKSPDGDKDFEEVASFFAEAGAK